MKASVLYKWLTYSAIVISVLLCLFMLQAGLKGNFRSVDTFQSYIRSFGIFAPFIFCVYTGLSGSDSGSAGIYWLRGRGFAFWQCGRIYL